MWQCDEDTHVCPCGQVFSMFVRKHHCRLCGKIYCDQCTLGRSVIPSFIQTTIQITKVRLCSSCMGKCTEINKSEPLVRVFALLPISIRQIKLLRLCKRWDHAVSTLLDVYKKIPSKMPYERFSRLETQILKTHKHRTGGHSCWDIQVIRCLREIPERRKFSCDELGCVHCEVTNSKQAIEIMNAFPSTHLLRDEAICKWLADKLNKLSTTDIVRFMPWILKRSMTPSAQAFIKKNIVPRCSFLNVAYAFYYECKLHSEPVYSSLSAYMLDKNAHVKVYIQKTDKLISYVEGLIKNERCDVDLPARLPYNPDIMCKSVFDPVQLKSASAPTKITMNTSAGLRHVLVKTECTQKDRLVMVIAHLIESLCKTKCVQYPVFCTPCGGWIEMLPDAHTLYDLKYELSSHIYNTFPNSRVRTVRRRFIHSAVGACILSYLVGAGDRHLQNMVISNGELAHVDFAYILGEEPKLKMNIRITPAMIIMMGGSNSIDYSFFVSSITKTFQKMRLHTGLWYSLLTYLEDDFDLGFIQDHISRKLMPSLENAQASMRIVDIVKHNSNTWRHSVSDITHQIFQMDF